MAEHEHFIKKTASKTVVSVKHILVTSGQQRRVDSVRRKSTISSTPPLGRRSDVSTAAGRTEPMITSLRFEYCVIRGRKKKIHRVFVCCGDSGSYCRVGWVLNDDVDACMVCHSLFYEALVSGKHHCRACGNIVCSSCSAGRAIVCEVQALGLVRVCSQCYFGQEAVSAHLNDICGESYPLAAGYRDDDIVCDDPDEVELTLNLWGYGPLQLAEIFPAFVVRTRRGNRERVYVNICSCEQVPLNSTAFVEGKRVIYFVCGSMGRTPDGFVVYDVALHPSETAACAAGVSGAEVAKTEVCEQALICVSALTSERDFHSYQWETDCVYRPRLLASKMTKQPLQQQTADGAMDGIVELGEVGDDKHHWMAIPASAAFADLMQCCTKLKDLVPEVDGNGAPVVVAINKESAAMHKDRLLRKLAARSVSQIRVSSLATEELFSQHKSITLTPYPGFVIKTHKASDHLKKVFINVYHHDSIDQFIADALQDGAAVDEPHVLVSDATDVSDKEGVISLLYHVAVASKYFLESYAQSHTKITDSANVKVVLTTLNNRYQDDLDLDSFVLPRVKGGFKGDWIADDMMFSFSRPRSQVASPSTAVVALNSAGDEPDSFLPLPRAPRDSECDSIVSDITTATDATGFTLTRKSVLDIFYPHKQRPGTGKLHTNNSGASKTGAVAAAAPSATVDGKDMITAEMLLLNRALNLDLRGALQLKALSVTDPLVLTGWQLTLFDKNNKSGVFPLHCCFRMSMILCVQTFTL